MLLNIKSYVNKKFEENINDINLLKSEIEKNKISLKNNEEGINFLRSQIIGFKNPQIIELNKRFNLNITDINIEKLDLSFKKIGNEGIKYLENVNFKMLKN